MSASLCKTTPGFSRSSVCKLFVSERPSLKLEFQSEHWWVSPFSQRGLVRGVKRGLMLLVEDTVHCLLCFRFLNFLPQKISLFFFHLFVLFFCCCFVCFFKYSFLNLKVSKWIVVRKAPRMQTLYNRTRGLSVCLSVSMCMQACVAFF